MMGEEAKVWATDWLTDKAKYIQNISFWKPARMREFLNCNRWGTPIAEDNLPAFAYLDPHSSQKERQDCVMISSAVLLISHRFADLLREFDLGAPKDLGPGHRRVDFYPMPLFAADQETHLADYLFMQVSVQKSALAADMCSGLRGDSAPYIAHSGPKDGNIVLTHAALEGPDIWRDEAVMNGIFVSDRLKRAMEDAKIEPVGFIACDLVEA